MTLSCVNGVVSVYGERDRAGGGDIERDVCAEHFYADKDRGKQRVCRAAVNGNAAEDDHKLKRQSGNERHSRAERRAYLHYRHHLTARKSDHDTYDREYKFKREIEYIIRLPSEQSVNEPGACSTVSSAEDEYKEHSGY